MLGEAIYKGATRPAMKLGIPLVPLVVLFGAGMLLVMWGGIFLSWWVSLGVLIAIAPALAWMRFVTARDDQRCRRRLNSEPPCRLNIEPGAEAGSELRGCGQV